MRWGLFESKLDGNAICGKCTLYLWCANKSAPLKEVFDRLGNSLANTLSRRTSGTHALTVTMELLGEFILGGSP